MNFLDKINENLMLAQFQTSSWDLKSVATVIIVVLVVLAVVGVFIQNDKVRSSLAWVPQWVWTLLGILAVALAALWVIRQV